MTVEEIRWNPNRMSYSRWFDLQRMAKSADPLIAAAAGAELRRVPETPREGPSLQRTRILVEMSKSADREIAAAAAEELAAIDSAGRAAPEARDLAVWAEMSVSHDRQLAAAARDKLAHLVGRSAAADLTKAAAAGRAEAAVWNYLAGTTSSSPSITRLQREADGRIVQSERSPDVLLKRAGTVARANAAMAGARALPPSRQRDRLIRRIAKVQGKLQG